MATSGRASRRTGEGIFVESHTGERATLKKMRAGEYVLLTRSAGPYQPGRSRWGNAKQICQDVRVLPRSPGPSWY
jgi:hypothetical protein